MVRTCNTYEVTRAKYVKKYVPGPKGNHLGPKCNFDYICPGDMIARITSYALWRPASVPGRFAHARAVHTCLRCYNGEVDDARHMVFRCAAMEIAASREQHAVLFQGTLPRGRWR